MDDRDDGMDHLALGVAGAAVALTVAIVLAVAIGSRGAPASAGIASVAVPPGAEMLRFGAEGDALSAEAADRLARLAEALRHGEAETVFVTPTFASPAEVPLATRRAVAVRHALEANGVEAERVVVNPAQPRAPGGEGVELVVR